MANSQRLTPIQWIDLRHRGDRLRVRYLRTADAAADRRPGIAGAWRAHAAARRSSPTGSACCSTCRRLRRHLRLAGRLSDRPVRPPARADVEHPAVRVLGVRGRLFDESVDAAVLRTTTFIGVCVEFVAAVAWLAELFDDPKQREKVLGYTQAFSSFGGLLVAIVNGLVARYAAELPAIDMPDFLQPMLGTRSRIRTHAWRYTLMSGLIPAIPLILIRPFLPESPKWAAKKAAGTLQRPSIARAVLAGTSPDDDRHHDHVRLQLRRGVRRDPAVAADRARHSIRCARRLQTATAGKPAAEAKASPAEDDAGNRRQLHEGAGDWAGCSAGSRWRCWWCTSPAAAHCCACS